MHLAQSVKFCTSQTLQTISYVCEFVSVHVCVCVCVCAHVCVWGGGCMSVCVHVHVCFV